MPFEPLKTDEPSATPGRRSSSDLDSRLLKGCLTIGIGAIVLFSVIVLPWLFADVSQLRGLGVALAIGGGVSLILGAVAMRTQGWAGMSAFLGGGLSGAVFMALRLLSQFAGKNSPTLVQPEYPQWWVWALPLVWTVLCVAWCLIFLNRDIDKL